MSIPPNDYFDLGSWQSWNFMDWQTGTVNQTALNQWLDSYASQAKAGGLKEVTLSFGQICDLQSIISGNFLQGSSSDDALKILCQNTGGKGVNGMSVLQYMVQRLNTDGMKVELSFGGATATAADWNFGFSATNTPQALAQSLANWAHQMGFSGIDFDFEDGSATMVSTNGASNLAQFFASLHQDLRTNGITSTMTVMGDSTLWGITSPNSYFSSMFSQGTNFSQMFDGLNLMLYNGQYYLNAGQQPPQSWDLTAWISQLQKNTGLTPAQCAEYLHVGFDGGVDYTQASSSGGPLPYAPPAPSGLSNGQTAAWIFQQLIKELQTYYNDPNLSLAPPFFWDDHANYTVDPKNPSSQFFNNNSFDLDFMKYLSKIS
jgi:GH18 family chitinase